MRIYIRCVDCLSISALDESSGEAAGPLIAAHSDYDLLEALRAFRCLCKGQLEFMGRVVQGNRLAKEKRVPVCDGRCTNAQGPICDCFCMGKNHGSQKVKVWSVDAGGIPHGDGLPVEHGEAAWFRENVLAAQALLAERYGAVLEQKKNGKYLGNNEFRKYLEFQKHKRALGETISKRTHEARERGFKRIFEALKPQEVQKGIWTQP